MCLSEITLNVVLTKWLFKYERMALAQSSTIHHISLPAQQAASCSAIGTVAVCAVLRRLRGVGICKLIHAEVPPPSANIRKMSRNDPTSFVLFLRKDRRQHISTTFWNISEKTANVNRFVVSPENDRRGQGRNLTSTGAKRRTFGYQKRIVWKRSSSRRRHWAQRANY